MPSRPCGVVGAGGRDGVQTSCMPIKPTTPGADATSTERGRIMPRIARPGIESSERLGRHRWVVERTHAWFNRYRRLPVRRAGIYEAFTSPIARNQIKRFR